MQDMTSDNHLISIVERETTNISGIKKIISFDDEEFLIESVFGPIEIKGVNLEIIKLDTYQGTISIKGIVNSVIYLDEEGKKERGILSKLFKWY